MAVCHTDNSNKFFQRPACVREPGGRKNQLSAPREERATLEVTCLELAVLHFVRIFHTSRRQLLACRMRPSRALHSRRKGCLNFSHRYIPLKRDQSASMHKEKGHVYISKHRKCLHSRILCFHNAQSQRQVGEQSV